MSTLFYKECANAALITSIGTANGKTLRTLCTSVSISVVLTLCTVAIVILYFTKQKRWVTYLPAWIGIGYGIFFAPLNNHLNYVSEISFLDSGLSKSEWVNHISADARVRMSVIASLTSACIVSANAWISRIESKNP
jgi:hypothetical protein